MTRCLRCLGGGSLVVQRLSKKQAKEGVKFINLLRSGGIPVRHCRNVTCEPYKKRCRRYVIVVVSSGSVGSSR